ncbi:hypothetical protein [Nibrella saemangeumensis]
MATVCRAGECVPPEGLLQRYPADQPDDLIFLENRYVDGNYFQGLERVVD